MVLYEFPGGDGIGSVSPPCLKVELALRRIGADFRIEYLKTRPEVRRVSKTGRLPVLEIDGTRIADSIGIMDELERRFPEAGLSPADPVERTRDRLWEHFFNDHVYWLGFYLRWIDDDNRDRLTGALFAQAPLMMRLMGPRVLRRDTRARAEWVGIAGKSLDEVTASYERAVGMAETGLAGGPYLDGRDQPGRGDLAAASIVGQAGFRGTLPDIEARARRHPAVLDHTRRVFEACSTPPPAWLEN